VHLTDGAHRILRPRRTAILAHHCKQYVAESKDMQKLISKQDHYGWKVALSSASMTSEPLSQLVAYLRTSITNHKDRVFQHPGNSREKLAKELIEA
jgi:hypothetical protein